MKQIPVDFKEYTGESIMSNFDHVIVQDTIKAIKGQKLYSGYTGWEFYGNVWFQNNQWHCLILTYGRERETISANNLEDIMERICNCYGND